MSDLQQTFVAFREQCVWIQTCFDTNRELFGSGTERHDVMRRTAAAFFGELHQVLYEYYILQVCKLTDPQESGFRGDKRENLTVALLDSMLKERGLLTQRIEEISASLHRYRQLVVVARHRSISHLDKETALTFVEYGEHTRQEAEAFLDYMHEYVAAVGEACEVDPLDFRSTAGPGDVSDLFRALNGGSWVPPSGL